MKKSYDKMAIWGDGENFILCKEDVMPWLAYGVKQIRDSEYYDADAIGCYIAGNKQISKEIKNINSDLIGLSYHPMSDWYFVNMGLVDEYKNGELI